MTGHLVLASSIHIGGRKWAGNFTTLDLIAAGTNALNGALLARRPDHYKNFTVVGIILMALLMGLGGGITRDVLVNQVPGALTNPAYITVAMICGIIGYLLAYRQGQMFREGLFDFVTSSSLPLWPSSALKGSPSGSRCDVLTLAVIRATPERYVDVSCGVPPKQLSAASGCQHRPAAGIVWVICDAAGLNTWWSAGISFVVGHLRVLACTALGGPGQEPPLRTRRRTAPTRAQAVKPSARAP
jgi:hypothetical protein